MTAPSTPTEPSETRPHTFASRDIALLKEIDLRASFDEEDRRMLSNPEIDRCVVMENDGLLISVSGWYVLTNAGRVVLAAVAAPVPPERDDDVIGAIVSALEAEAAAVTKKSQDYWADDTRLDSDTRGHRISGQAQGLRRALQIVRDIAGRGVP